MLRFLKRIPRNFAWSLVAAVIIVEGHHFQRVLLVLGLALAGAVFYSLFDAAQERWPQPLTWHWKRLVQGKRSD